MTIPTKPTKHEPCPQCSRKPIGDQPAGDNDFFLCSRIECPSRRQVTASPSDRSPLKD